MVLIIPQRCWYYADEANQFFEFMDSETGNTPDLRYHPLQNSTVCATDVTQARPHFWIYMDHPFQKAMLTDCAN